MVETQKQVTIDQHYVPRFYLKNFALVKGVGRKEKAFISFYQFEDEFYKEHIPTKSVCYKEYFYGEDGKVENEFANREKEWANVINEIIQNKQFVLDNEQKKLLKQFAIYQYCRTLATYNHGKRMMSEMLSQTFINNNPGVDEEIVREIVTKKVDKQVNVADVINSCDELVDLIEDLDIAIIRCNTSKKLITSDMPVIVMNPFCVGKAGMANVGIVILFPISPEILIVIYDGKIYQNCKGDVVISNDSDVEKINMYQIISAEERILSQNVGELEEYVQNKELIAVRNTFCSESKVNTSYDGFGTFVAAKSRSMRYLFDISIFNLPKCLRKIPKDCREAFDRKYSYDAWISLLVRVYKIPELLKQRAEFSQSDVKQRKEGYSKMLKVMEDYWEMPNEVRTITPELMYKLKNVPTTFFPLDS